LSNRLLHNFLFHDEITTGELHFAVGKSPFHDPIVDAKALEIKANMRMACFSHPSLVWRPTPGTH